MTAEHNLTHGAQADIRGVRREAVERLRLRGMSCRQIVRALPSQGIFGPKGKPVTRSTIQNDLAENRLTWQKLVAQSFDTHVARTMAEYNEVKRAMWAEKNHDGIARVLEKQCRLLGLNAPVRQEITGKDGGPVEIADVSESGAAALKILQDAGLVSAKLNPTDEVG